MKKLSVLLCLLLLAFVVVGCGSDKKEPQAPSSSASDILGNQITVPNGADNTASSPKITPERAKEIAFESAAVKPEEAKFVEVEYDYDDDWRGYEYSIEFNVGSLEYDIEINAETGEVLKLEKSYDD